MADKKISELAERTTATGAEEFVFSGTSENGRIGIDAIKNYIGGIEEAPSDGHIYGRQNGEWVVITETVNVTLATNQAATTSLLEGTPITLTTAEGAQTVNYDGNSASFDVMDGVEYTLSVASVDGFAKPANQTYVAQAGNTRNVTFNYNSTALTVGRDTDPEGDLGSITVQVKVDGALKESVVLASDTDTALVYIPTGSSYQVVFPSVQGWATPSSISGTATTASATATGTYKATVLQIVRDSNQSESLGASTATVSYSGTSQTVTFNNSGNTKTVWIPRGVSYTVSFSAIQHYATPSSVSGTATTASATATGTYRTEVVTVSLSASNGASMSGQQVVINGEAVTYSGSSIVRKIPFGTQYSVSVNAKDGYVTPQSQTYTAGQASRSISMEYVHNPIKYSYITLNQGITDPATMLSGDINGEAVQDIRANSHRVLAKYTANGTMTYAILDDTASTMYYDGTAANLDGSEGDVMMKLPVFYWQCVHQSGDVWKLGLCYGGNPGAGWNKWEGDKALLGVFESYNSGSKAYSRSGVSSTGNVSQANWKTYARNRGTGFSIVTWEWHCIMALLYYCQYGHMNCQAQIGAGTNSYDKIMGQTYALGMEDTKASTNGNSLSINFWGLENWWGNKYEWVDNVVIDARSWKITPMDGSATRNPGSGTSSNGWISKMLLGEKFDLIPTAAGGSETTGYCDYYYQSSSSARVVRRSGYYSGTDGGVAFVNAYVASSYTNSGYGSRLAFWGELVKAGSVAAYKAAVAIG